MGKKKLILLSKEEIQDTDGLHKFLNMKHLAGSFISCSGCQKNKSSQKGNWKVQLNWDSSHDYKESNLNAYIPWMDISQQLE